MHRRRSSSPEGRLQFKRERARQLADVFCPEVTTDSCSTIHEDGEGGSERQEKVEENEMSHAPSSTRSKPWSILKSGGSSPVRSDTFVERTQSDPVHRRRSSSPEGRLQLKREHFRSENSSSISPPLAGITMHDGGKPANEREMASERQTALNATKKVAEKERDFKERYDEVASLKSQLQRQAHFLSLRQKQDIEAAIARKNDEMSKILQQLSEYRGVLQDQLETGRVAAKFRKDWMKQADFVSAQEAEEVTEIRM